VLIPTVKVEGTGGSFSVACVGDPLFTEYRDFGKKLPAFEKILRRARLKPAEVCFVGDDVTDLPLFARVGLAVAVANAHPEAKKRAHYVTRARGGHGAVREVIDLILRAQGHYAKLLRQFG